MRSRRAFLGGSAGATAALLARPLISACAADATFQTRRIDVHHHLLPPAYVDAVGDALRRQAPDFAFVLQWSPARSLDAMDQAGIATAITSLSTPGVSRGDVPAARTLARACNEYAAGLVRDHPGRFGFWATLPMPDVDGSLAEIAYALDVLHADGIGFLSDYGTMWLGDPAFAPVFDELQRRKAIAFVHPSVATCCQALLPGVPPAVVEFVFDTTRTIVSLLYGGTFTRCPDIRFIFPQDGGTMPMIAERIAHSVKPAMAATMPNGPLGELQKLYFDVATSTSKPALDAVLGLVDASHVMFGTDYPFLPTTYTSESFDRSHLSVSEKAAINRLTAARLLPRYA